MRIGKLFESFSYVDGELIERSETRHKGRAGVWIGAVALAACAAIVVGLAALPRGGSADYPSSPGAPPTDPGVQEGPGAPSEPGAPTMPGEPTAPSEPGEPSEPTTPGSPGEEPPKLIFNDVENAVAVSPPKWFFELTDTPMSARQLELAWSGDCPTAFLEDGEAQSWYYGNSVSGEAQYMADGTLYCLRLTFREEDNHIPALVTVSPVDGPLFTGCAVTENVEAEPSQIFECYAYRYDFGDRYIVASEFTIGADRYRVSAQAAPEDLEAAESIVYDATVRFWANFIKGVCPDLSSFHAGDSTGGRLAGEDRRVLLKLRNLREDTADGDFVVYRNGAVERGCTVDDGADTYIVSDRWALSDAELTELYGLFGRPKRYPLEGAHDYDSQFVLTLYDPWGRSHEPTPVAPDHPAIARLLEILGIE